MGKMKEKMIAEMWAEPREESSEELDELGEVQTSILAESVKDAGWLRIAMANSPTTEPQNVAVVPPLDPCSMDSHAMPLAPMGGTWVGSLVKPAVDPAAVRAFNFTALLLPKRVLDEDLGDAMEQINTLRAAGGPRWQIYLKIISSILWAIWSAVKSPSASTHKAKK